MQNKRYILYIHISILVIVDHTSKTNWIGPHPSVFMRHAAMGHASLICAHVCVPFRRPKPPRLGSMTDLQAVPVSLGRGCARQGVESGPRSAVLRRGVELWIVQQSGKYVHCMHHTFFFDAAIRFIDYPVSLSEKAYRDLVYRPCICRVASVFPCTCEWQVGSWCSDVPCSRSESSTQAAGFGSTI